MAQRPNAARSAQPGADIAAEFTMAYRDLAAAMAPVTAQSLRDTSDEHGRRIFGIMRKKSEAAIWSTKLWGYTGLALLFIIFTENLENILLDWYPADHLGEGETDAVIYWHMVKSVLFYILPFAYGLLGACTYLLKSCHLFIHQRSFDPNRIPEYKNRMILGLIAGGAILLFVERIIDDGEVINISSAALAFIAGYNIDFLFQALERMAEAILPKVGLQSVRRARAAVPAAGTVSIEQLVRQMNETADPEDKQAIRDLIERLSRRE